MKSVGTDLQALSYTQVGFPQKPICTFPKFYLAPIDKHFKVDVNKCIAKFNDLSYYCQINGVTIVHVGG